MSDDVAELHSQIVDLSKQLSETEAELAVWKFQYVALFEQHVRGEFTRFKSGEYVTFRGRPAWGAGVVEKVRPGVETYDIRWLRADAAFSTTSEAFAEDLEVAETGQLELHIRGQA